MRSAPRRSLSDKAWDAAIASVVGLFVILCVAPLLHVAAMSLSSNAAILGSRVSFWPVESSLASYRGIFSDRSMIRSLFFTAALTASYTAIAMLLTIFAAYALTKRRLRGRNVFLVLIVITMYFSGGLIPDYLLVRDLRMLNTVWALILPGAVSAYYLLILKTFFAQLPESFEESAIVEGASDIQVLFRIVLALSGPALASISLFYAVAKWNSFMDALFYINSPSLYPLQLKLYQIIVNSTSIDVAAMEGSVYQGLLPESLKAACVVFAIVPIVIVYPWLQKYFIKGVMIGGIKG